MTDSHAKLFEPFTLNNGVTLQSRLVIAPLTLYCQNPDGTVSEAERDFISSRGRNFGMVIHGATLVSDNGQGFPGQPRAIRDYDLQALKERVRLTHANGSLAIAQIHHAGILGNPAFLRDHVPVGPSENEECISIIWGKRKQDSVSKLKCAVLLFYVSESSVSVGVQLFSSACNSEVNRCALSLPQ